MYTHVYTLYVAKHTHVISLVGLRMSLCCHNLTNVWTHSLTITGRFTPQTDRQSARNAFSFIIYVSR